MKLDRNEQPNGRGKYALLLMRKVEQYTTDSITESNPVLDAIWLLESEGLIDWGEAGTEREFFVIRLRDKFAGAALSRYAAVAASEDAEYAQEVAGLAHRAGENSPFCKTPD
jgi:hypothetical protein